MMDIAPGDLVEACFNWAHIRAGDRAVVLEIGVSFKEIPCNWCNYEGPGFNLTIPTPFPYNIWCPNHWKKISGPPQDEAVNNNELVNAH